MKRNYPDEFSKAREEILLKWHDREHYSQIEEYRNQDEFNALAKRIRERYLPHALYLNKLHCPKCKKLFDDINDFQYILEYCDNCRCNLEIDDQELTT